MSALEELRPAEGRGRSMRLAAAIVVAVVAAACAGENTFFGPAKGRTLLGPSVEITAPEANATVAVGDSVTVTAAIESGQDITSVKVTGAFTNGATAFGTKTAEFQSAVRDTTVTYRIGQVGTTTGTVSIAVEATDIESRVGADTVRITIGS